MIKCFQVRSFKKMTLNSMVNFFVKYIKKFVIYIYHTYIGWKQCRDSNEITVGPIDGNCELTV